METELLHDVGAMRFHGAHGDTEGRGNFFVGFAIDEQANDFQFARRGFFPAQRAADDRRSLSPKC